MRRLIWLPIAGFLLVAGAAVAAAAPSVLNHLTPVVPAADATPAPSTAPSTVGQPDANGPETVLAKVLADLVAKGTITQAQADAITSGVQTEIANRRAAIEKLRQEWQQTRAQIQQFLADGVITKAEIDTLPADNPLRQAFDSIAQNGQVTLQQLQQFLPFGGEFMGKPGFGPMGPGFGRHGWMGWPGTPDQNPSASPSP